MGWLALSGCAHARADTASPLANVAGSSGDERANAFTPPSANEPAGVVQPSSREIPVGPSDGVWGDALAPVTIVVFTDLECPYCAVGHRTLIELERRYGPSRLRVVVKHLPLGMHPGAAPAARVAQAVLALGGRTRFFEYLDLAFSHQDQIADGRALELARPLGLDRNALAELSASAEIGAQVLAHVTLADAISVQATPHHRVNGLALTGTQPLARFIQLIDDELREAERLHERGIAADEIYSRRVTLNFGRPESGL